MYSMYGFETALNLTKENGFSLSGHINSSRYKSNKTLDTNRFNIVLTLDISHFYTDLSQDQFLDGRSVISLNFNKIESPVPLTHIHCKSLLSRRRNIMYDSALQIRNPDPHC